VIILTLVKKLARAEGIYENPALCTGARTRKGMVIVDLIDLFSMMSAIHQSKSCRLVLFNRKNPYKSMELQ